MKEIKDIFSEELVSGLRLIDEQEMKTVAGGYDGNDYGSSNGGNNTAGGSTGGGRDYGGYDC